MPETPPGFSPWTPDAPGKGLLIDDRLFEWATTEQGAPQHKDALAALGIADFDVAKTAMFAFSAEGEIAYVSNENLVEMIITKDSRLQKTAPSEAWSF